MGNESSSVGNSSTVLRDQSRCSVGSTSSGASSGPAISELDRLRAQIEGHLTGHGRRPRGFWKEIWMLVWDYDEEKAETVTSNV